MHAVVFQVDLKEGWESSSAQDLDTVVGLLSSVPGFLRGTWLADGKRGISVIEFESEEAAHGVADNASMPPDSTATLRSADVYAVVRKATSDDA